MTSKKQQRAQSRPQDGDPARQWGRDPFAHTATSNPPVYHASTLLYPSAEDYIATAAIQIRPPRHTDRGAPGESTRRHRGARNARRSRCCRQARRHLGGNIVGGPDR